MFSSNVQIDVDFMCKCHQVLRNLKWFQKKFFFVMWLKKMSLRSISNQNTISYFSLCLHFFIKFTFYFTQYGQQCVFYPHVKWMHVSAYTALSIKSCFIVFTSQMPCGNVRIWIIYHITYCRLYCLQLE